MLVLTAGTVVWKVRIRRGLKTWEYGADLPSFSFPAIAAATDNFSDVNFIGEGGFGSVYKGHLSTNREVAVKRLSKNSGQGLEEFTNEVILISRLQHKNLVGLVGCCIEKTERMLIYEYMPNKSLDYFIFDRVGRCSLTWERRYSIVCGIARGLVYLHHDSKLPVVHRDLKASNILLDGDLNPKISDFGLARIFTGNDKAKTTRRIIGSHGYMSPEYASEGEFSTKSDVYSFGVLLLEIVSGRRNVGFRHPDHQHNLLGHVWLLWLAGRVLELVDEPGMELSEPQAERCIHVGLLCVQKLPVDRPSMEAAVVMLANEGAELPQPKQPGFFQEQTVSGAKECYPHTCAVATMTLPQGR
ncbi:hypothetical protein MLD38_034206 [Melastoma candidum]|uniref:Uncharacterized protein n=1 Tax=Melastoma candidum TaxID=119954 RepID=A0ACB9MD04_9MYRT|nr:hypothetical protein MLD38_034206 [Melastoma candidum]